MNRAKVGNEIISRATPKVIETVQSMDVSCKRDLCTLQIAAPTVDVSDYPFTIDTNFVCKLLFLRSHV